MILNGHANWERGRRVLFTNAANGKCIHMYSTYRLTILATFQKILLLDLKLHLLMLYHLSKCLQKSSGKASSLYKVPAKIFS